eukprot:TRINITY_DN20215_c0_g1_i1.p1 TRINITY_DN20215_c0_g1~~TRINITY_DN20215_c0_g1_i1.p1  ORF type:complete len:182 (+),score=52.11 TRINITY_DN20215_c0_g1_i1:14-559(+)
MGVFINLSGDNCVKEVTDLNKSIATIKSELIEEFGFEGLNLVCEGVEAQDEQSVFEFEGRVLQAEMALDAEGKKRGKKKKQYKTPKRIKHKHQNVKMRALSYYAIKNDGTAEAVRRPSPVLGNGYFMAKHFNRFYCGKTHTTLMIEGAPKHDPNAGKKKKVEEKVVEEEKKPAGKGKKGKK